MDLDDHELIRSFRATRSEPAFQELIRRHLPMVFAMASRVTGDPALAEEIAQSTFARLADNAATLKDGTIVAGWLYQTARNLALTAARAERRRRQREQFAAAMPREEPAPHAVAEQLETAMDRLTPQERDVLILRYFEERNLREVGRELGLGEDAARMRVNRALEKLRGIFGRLGVTGSAAWLATTLPASATAAVPAGLSATIVTSVLGGASVATVTALTTTSAMLNLKTTAAIFGAAVVTGTSTYFVKEQQVEDLRANHQQISQEFAQLTASNREAMAALRFRDEQIARLKQDAADIHRLRGEVDRVNRELEATAEVRRRHDAIQAELEGLRTQLGDSLSGQPNLPASEEFGMVATNELSVPSDEFRKRYGLPPEALKDSDASEKPRLFTRSFTVDAEGIAVLAKKTSRAGEVESGGALLEAYLAQRGVVLEPPEAVFLNENSGQILIRASLAKLEMIQPLIAQLQK